MADDIAEEIRPYVHEILRIVLNVKGKTLRELNKLVGQTNVSATSEIAPSEPIIDESLPECTGTA
ncbi:hypothetical protein M7I_1622 [Glarea lozoyensis 74030]|uniref:Uncharacterized protein n=1 Tax=Glarea lozoyensis (strain ATCC 74030 / MF5533) TaxID=1104152 RepID=H0EGK6_GLAL7|nr:hypothetical protein M7I_1622 [Glarea lozoyensis 74030]